MALDFDKQAQQGNEILKQLAKELGDSSDRKKAGRVLRAVLYGIRDNITIEENFQLLSQLPMTLKGLYVQDWHPHKKKSHNKSIKKFIDKVKRYDTRTGNYDFGNEVEARTAIIAVLNLLKNYISEGEIKDIQSVMPKALEGLWDEQLLLSKH